MFYKIGESDDEKSDQVTNDTKCGNACIECEKTSTDLQKLEKKFKKLKKRYLSLCVRFAESEMKLNNLIKANAVKPSNTD